jgi:putative hydrolase of the HAD superfamily
MAPLRAVTFDCAGTLVRVNWRPGEFALKCAKACGLVLDAQPAREVYERLLGSRWEEYRALNQTRDAAVCRHFWHQLTTDWLEQIGESPEGAAAVMETADHLLYDPNGPHFKLFDDALETLEALSGRGLRLGILSNWDYSLHRVVRTLGIDRFFITVIASLEEGVEKPDPGLFRIALDRLGVRPEEAVHVGDDPLDDVSGAHACGMGAILLDRSLDRARQGAVPSLAHLTEALPWSG